MSHDEDVPIPIFQGFNDDQLANPQYNSTDDSSQDKYEVSDNEFNFTST